MKVGILYSKRLHIQVVFQQKLKPQFLRSRLSFTSLIIMLMPFLENIENAYLYLKEAVEF